MAFGRSAVGVRRRDIAAEHVGIFLACHLLGPIVDFAARVVVIVRDIWGAYALTHRAAMLGDLSLHIPVPLVYLVLFEAEPLLKFYNLGLRPARVLLELKEQYFILLFILTEPFMLFLGSFIPVVADHDSGNLVWQ